MRFVAWMSACMAQYSEKVCSGLRAMRTTCRGLFISCARISRLAKHTAAAACSWHILLAGVGLFVFCGFLVFLCARSSLWLAITFILFLLSPNIYSMMAHGTPDLLLASGYTIDSWTAERRGNHLDLDLSQLCTRPAIKTFYCTLCLVEVPKATLAVYLPCQHAFCAANPKCPSIHLWLQQKGNCPLCRQSLKRRFKLE